MTIQQMMFGGNFQLELVGGTMFSRVTYVDVPAGTQVGDLAIIIDQATNTDGTGLAVAAVPAGWTRLVSYAGNPTSPASNYYAFQIVYQKITASYVGGTRISGLGAAAGANADTAKFIMTYRPSRPYTSISTLLIDNLQIASPTTPRTITCNISGLTNPFVLMTWCIYGVNPRPDATFSPIDMSSSKLIQTSGNDPTTGAGQSPYFGGKVWHWPFFAYSPNETITYGSGTGNIEVTAAFEIIP